MNPSKVGSQGPIDPNKFSSDLSIAEEFRVKKAAQKNRDIPSAASLQVELPKLVEKVIEIVDYNQTPMGPDQVIAEEIEQQTKILEVLADPKRKSVKAIVKERMNTELDKLVAKEKKIETVEDGLREALTAVQLPTEILHTAGTEPYAYAVDLLPMAENHKAAINKIVMPVEITRTILQGVELIGDGAALIVQAEHYLQSKILLTEKKIQLRQNPADENLKLSVFKLRNYVSAQWEALKDKIVNFSSSFATVSLKTTDFILGALEAIAPLTKAAVGWAITLLDVLAESITLWRAQKAKTTHEAWMTQIAKDQRTFQQAEELLSRRRERMILNKAEKLTFPELKATLNEKGIDFDAQKIVNFDDFKARLGDQAFKKDVMERFIDAEDEKEDTINVMTRNSVQALSEAKVKNEKKFFNFKLNKSKIALTLACLSSALAITLEILALVGVIAASASMLAVPGLGFFVLGLGLTGIGLYFFYKHKPNLFKCFIRGVNLRLAFFHLPAKIRVLQLSLKRADIKSKEITSVKYELLKGLIEKQKTLTLTAYPKELQKLLEKLHKATARKVEDFEQLGLKEQLQKFEAELENRKISHRKKIEAAEARRDELIKKVDAWTGENGRLTKLQNQLKEAGNKDFAIANNLLTTAQGQELNIPMVIIEKILYPGSKFEFDEETLKILKDKMNIDIAQISHLIKKEQGNDLMEKNRELMIDKLKEFFKMDDDELLAFMRERLAEKQLNLPHGKVA